MAKSCNQKAKILYLERMFLECTGNKTLSMQEIISSLEANGVRAERKSIYDDMETLRAFGMDIRYRRGKDGGYYLASSDAPALPAKRMEEEQTVQVPIQSELSVQEETAVETRQEKEYTYLEPIFKNVEKDGRLIRLLCSNSVRGEVMSALGSRAEYKEKGESGFTVSVSVVESGLFYGWLVSLGKNVHILKPRKAAIEYREYLKSIAKDYKGIEK